MSNLILNNFASLNICFDQFLNLHELFVDIFICEKKIIKKIIDNDRHGILLAASSSL